MRLRPLPLPAGRRRDPDPSANRNHNPLDLRAEYLLRLTRRARRERDPTTGNPRSDGVRIDAALVRRLIAAQFPRWADLPVRPVEAGGWDNRTFRIGSPMTARLSSAEQYALQVEKGRRWLPKLAPLLPLPIPVPLAKGASAEVYPWQWSVYRRIEGEAASVGRIADLRRFATDLAEFLNALRRIDPTGGPSPGRHNFSRGGPLTVYDAETRQATVDLEGRVEADAASAVWKAALGTKWDGLARLVPRGRRVRQPAGRRMAG